MKNNKWYSRIIGDMNEVEEVNYKRKRMEVYELFKKNRYKKHTEAEEKKTS